MNLVQRFKQLVAGVSEALVNELTQMIATINTWANVEHHTDGRHKHITADSLTVSGVSTLDDTVTDTLVVTTTATVGDNEDGGGDLYVTPSATGYAFRVVLGQVYVGPTSGDVTLRIEGDINEDKILRFATANGGGLAYLGGTSLFWFSPTDTFSTGLSMDTSGNLSATGSMDAASYKVGGVAGASFSGAITNLTVVNGIVTAAS